MQNEMLEGGFSLNINTYVLPCDEGCWLVGWSVCLGNEGAECFLSFQSGTGRQAKTD